MRGLAAGLLALATSVGAQQPSVWGPLAPGPHPVGFRASWSFDPSRTLTIELDDGARYEGPRPLPVLTWYPAEAGSSSVFLLHEELFDVPVDASAAEDVRAFAAALARYAREVAEGELTGWRDGLSGDETEALAAVLATPTPATRDAPEAPGPRPVVVTHSGAASSFDDNALLCALLASHGFRVVASAYVSGDGASLETDGGDDSIQDLAFLAAQATAGEDVPVAYLGHSLGAQAVLKSAARADCPARAFVLLDTTQDYVTLETPLFERLVGAVLDGREHVRGSLLATAGPGAAMLLLDRLEHAERRYLTFPTLDHNDYIAQGLQRITFEEHCGRAVEHADTLRRELAALGEYLVAFLRAQLGGEADTLAALDARYATSEPAAAIHLETAPVGVTAPPRYEPGGGVPPTPRQFPHVLARLGVDATCALLEPFVGREPMIPLGHARMLLGTTLFGLVEAGDVEGARTLHGVLEPWRPGLLGVLRFQADVAGMLGRADDERRVLEAIVAIDPEHPGVRERLQKREAR